MKKRIIRAALTAAGALLGCAGALLIYLTATDYRPAAVEPLEISGSGGGFDGDELSLLSFNIGYGALGRESDFFMDGGAEVRPDSREIIEKNLAGIADIVATAGADICFLQEVDSDSHRSYNIDERAAIAPDGYASAYALNYSCGFVPFPLPPIGEVHSGLLTLSRFGVGEAERVVLPSPFKWPVSTANLKRCLLVWRIPVGNAELVLVNMHLEAYDDGAGKAEQFAALTELCLEEYAAGNYVVAGGDFNCTFPSADTELYPIVEAGNYVPGSFDMSGFGDDWQLVYDESTPTCRLLNKPYNGEDAQFCVIDGFILSPNVELLDVETLDYNFEYADHNPVLAKLRLR